MSWGRYRVEVAVEVEANDAATAGRIVEVGVRESFLDYEILGEPEVVAQSGRAPEGDGPL
jgi:hypothetical protein